MARRDERRFKAQALTGDSKMANGPLYSWVHGGSLPFGYVRHRPDERWTCL